MKMVVKIILVVFGMFLAFTCYAQKAVLKVGDPAPQIKYSKWIKGDPITAFKTDRLYVLEFWATWCGPCRAAMPHLTELQRQYHENLTIIGVNIWEDKKQGKPYDTFIPVVEKFVRDNDGMMDYAVVIDDNDQHMGTNWMKAAGQEGIPSTFVVKDRKIIWIGLPTALDSILPKILNGTYQMDSNRQVLEKTYAESRAELHAWELVSKPIRSAIDARRFDEATSLINKAVADNPNYKSVFYYWKFIALAKHAVSAASIKFGEEWMSETDQAAEVLINGLSKEHGLDSTIYLWAAKLNTKINELSSPFELSALAMVYARGKDFRNAVRYAQIAVSNAESALQTGKMPGVINAAIVSQFRSDINNYKLSKLPEQDSL